MRTYLASFVISFTLSLLLTPILARLSRRLLKWRPIQSHHSHSAETPRLGGVVIFLSFFAPLIGFFFYENAIAELFLSETRMVIGFFIGGLAILLLGCWDDIRELSAKRKLFFEILIATFAYACGFKITVVSFPFFEVLDLGFFSYVVTVCWIVGLINAMNLIDGVDALATGVALFASVTLGVISFISGHILTILYCSALTGALLGFIRYNTNPAKIFLGDSGSLFIGYILALISIQGSVKSSTAVALLTPIIAFGIPFLDMLVSVVRRHFRGLPFFAADKDHIHHRLLKMGFTPRKAVLFLYGMCVLLNGGALFLFVSKNQFAGIVLIGISVATLFVLGYVGYFRPQFFNERIEDLNLLKSLRRSRYLLRLAKEDLKTNSSLIDQIWHLTIKNCQILNIQEAQLLLEPRANLLFNTSRYNFFWKSTEEEEISTKELTQLILPIKIKNQLFGQFVFYWKSVTNSASHHIHLERLVSEIQELILNSEKSTPEPSQELALS